MRAANRFHDLVMGSAAGFRCARPTVKSTPDNVDPLTLTTISGTIDGTKLGSIDGRALYVTAFDAADADSNGMLAPGRSPVAETKLIPNGEVSISFTLKVPKGGKYILSSALDNGTGANKEDYVSASGSGGFGQAAQNPISAADAVTDISIQLTPAPAP
jgi:hypothetical protein